MAVRIAGLALLFLACGPPTLVDDMGVPYPRCPQQFPHSLGKCTYGVDTECACDSCANGKPGIAVCVCNSSNWEYEPEFGTGCYTQCPFGPFCNFGTDTVCVDAAHNFRESYCGCDGRWNTDYGLAMSAICQDAGTHD